MKLLKCGTIACFMLFSPLLFLLTAYKDVERDKREGVKERERESTLRCFLWKNRYFTHNFYDFDFILLVSDGSSKRCPHSFKHAAHSRSFTLIQFNHILYERGLKTHFSFFVLFMTISMHLWRLYFGYFISISIFSGFIFKFVFFGLWRVLFDKVNLTIP